MWFRNCQPHTFRLISTRSTYTGTDSTADITHLDEVRLVLLVARRDQPVHLSPQADLHPAPRRKRHIPPRAGRERDGGPSRRHHTGRTIWRGGSCPGGSVGRELRQAAAAESAVRPTPTWTRMKRIMAGAFAGAELQSGGILETEYARLRPRPSA